MSGILATCLANAGWNEEGEAVMSGDTVIVVDHVTKAYNSHRAVDDLSF